MGAVTQTMGDEEIRRAAFANPFDRFSLGIRERIGENDALATRFMNEPEFQVIAFEALARDIFEAVEAQAQPGRLPDG